MPKTFEEEIADIKQETFDMFKTSPRVWIIEERDERFIVHRWTPGGVGPASDYPTRRKAAARLLQLLEVGAVAPQTWPESVCIGTVTLDEAQS